MGIKQRYTGGILGALAVYVLLILTTERGLRSVMILGGSAARVGGDRVQKVVDDLDRAWAAAEQEKTNATDPETRERAEGKRQGVGLALFSVRRHLT